jgi:hypothetical protein
MSKNTYLNWYSMVYTKVVITIYEDGIAITVDFFIYLPLLYIRIIE